MKFINRDCIMVKPKKPFADWVNGYDEVKIKDEDILKMRSVYLVDELPYTSESDIEILMKNNFEEILVDQAFAWYEDEEYLPEKITFELFRDWFEYEYSDLVFDIGTVKIKRG